MTFKKLALATAIACVPVGAMAVDVLDDEMLSGVTGQDGIEIALDLAVTTNVIIHDTGGITSAAAPSHTFDGAIVMSGVSISATNGTAGVPDAVVIQIDAGDNAATVSAPVLNVNIALNGTTTINTGTVLVGNSRRDEAAWGYTGGITIMSNATIQLGATSANIQLGNEPQGNMITLNTVITNGVTINNSAIYDAGGTLTGGAIGSASMTILDNGGTNLTVQAGIDVTTDGLIIDIGQLGSGTGIDIRIVDQYLGTTAAGIIGDVEMTGIDLDGTLIAVSGKP